MANGMQAVAAHAATAGLALASIGSAVVVKLTGVLGGGELAALSLVGALPLYNRLNRSATFDNETRRRIFDYVKNMPGACIADIATQVGVSHSTASYHLDKLCGFSLLTSTTDGNKVRFFVNGGTFTEEERRTLAVLDNPETRRVLATIVKHPWCYRAELTTLLGVSSPTVNWHLERLASAGLVAENRNGRNRFLFSEKGRLGALLTTLLAKLAETGYDPSGLKVLLEIAAEP